MKTKLIKNTELTLLLEAIFFSLGLLFVIEPAAGLYYYFSWFGVVCITNLALIIRLIIKKPKNYIGYGISLLMIPIAATVILSYIIWQMMN